MNGENYKCINGLILKLIAIGTMLVDHIGAVLFPDVLFLRAIGRIAFPIFVFLITEGFLHTHSVRKYELRLLLFAFVSEIPFDLAFSNRIVDAEYQNVFFTLFLGLVMLDVMQTLREKFPQGGIFAEIALLAAFMAAAWALKTDYDMGGVLLIYLFYKLRGRFVWQGILLGVISYLFYNWLECFSVIAMLPIIFYNGQRGFGGGKATEAETGDAPGGTLEIACAEKRGGVVSGRMSDSAQTVVKWLFYIFYPAHLFVLYVIADCV